MKSQRWLKMSEDINSDVIHVKELIVKNINGPEGQGNPFTARGGLIITGGKNIELGTTTGTKIGTANTQKIGFWGVTPIVQPIAATGGGMTVDQLLVILQTTGIVKQA